MVDLQELIVRGRMIFDGASRRLEVFELVSGRSTKEIARKAGRGLPAVDKDLEKLRDLELILEKKDSKGNVIKKDGSIVYDKNPVIKHVPISYFGDVANTTKLVKKTVKGQGKVSKPAETIHVPSENEILDICKQGEDQLYEFKAPGVSADKITKEIAGFLHTKGGGVIFYGVEDDGSIIGADMRRQDLDQKIQNSVRNTVSPPPSIDIKERKIMGSTVLLIVIPPWDRKTIYQNTLDSRYYIRRGTNIFALRPDEMKKLSQGDFVV